ncbi:MAG: hypothetical protein WAX89_05120 [Alphaproteobacteria bacterium]
MTTSYPSPLTATYLQEVSQANTHISKPDFAKTLTFVQDYLHSQALLGRTTCFMRRAAFEEMKLEYRDEVIKFVQQQGIAVTVVMVTQDMVGEFEIPQLLQQTCYQFDW